MPCFKKFSHYSIFIVVILKVHLPKKIDFFLYSLNSVEVIKALQYQISI